MKKSVWLITLALTAATLSGCGGIGGLGISKDGDYIVIGISDEVHSVDPASGYDPGSWVIFNNVFQTLLSFQAGYTEPQLDAAKNCNFPSSTVYKCTLRDGLEFSNGNELTSKDVKFSFDRAIRINDPAGPAPLLATIKKIVTPDDKTVIFNLKVPDANFPSKIASGAGSIVDHSVYPPDMLRESDDVVGSGPYKIDSFDDTRALLAVNEKYKGTARIKNSGIKLAFSHGDQKALASSLEKGDIDVAYRGLSAEKIEHFSGLEGSLDEGIVVAEGGGAEAQYLVFNMNDPLVGKIGVRRAIAYVVDRETLTRDVYKGTVRPLYSIVPAGIATHTTDFFDRYGDVPQVEKARRELRAEGLGADKIRLTLWSTPTRYGSSTDKALQKVAEQLNSSELFEARVQSVPFDEYEKGVDAGEYGVYVKGWLPDYPDPDNFTQPFFGEGNVLKNNYKNNDITDTIIPRTSSQTDRADARKDFEEIQRQVARDVPILPLWQGNQYAASRGNITGLGWTLDSSTVSRFWELGKS
ncbi:ABC transporter substrate-binding protein [Streptomyces sp. ADI93-02]|uniref:ABC transporter substrate-binding protein n=1 Tax=Streptomyces sp. ADI93-02 TaxID=1522757 RepID=UPI001F155D44|nr:ABC transporter substrate-binding protein [Streptomyces sp. ADI93-02]